MISASNGFHDRYRNSCGAMPNPPTHTQHPVVGYSVIWVDAAGRTHGGGGVAWVCVRGLGACWCRGERGESGQDWQRGVRTPPST
jgi:hypothetical protein